MKEDPNIEPWFDPELEVRFVAMVLGESSDFERSELERMMEERPELKRLHHRLETVHGLVVKGTRTDIDPGGNFKLSADRRRAVMQRIGYEALADNQKKGSGWKARYTVWAAVAAMVIVSILVFTPSIGKPRGLSGDRIAAAPAQELKEDLATGDTFSFRTEGSRDNTGRPTTGSLPAIRPSSPQTGESLSQSYVGIEESLSEEGVRFGTTFVDSSGGESRTDPLSLSTLWNFSVDRLSKSEPFGQISGSNLVGRGLTEESLRSDLTTPTHKQLLTQYSFFDSSSEDKKKEALIPLQDTDSFSNAFDDRRVAGVTEEIENIESSLALTTPSPGSIATYGSQVHSASEAVDAANRMQDQMNVLEGLEGKDLVEAAVSFGANEGDLQRLYRDYREQLRKRASLIDSDYDMKHPEVVKADVELRGIQETLEENAARYTSQLGRRLSVLETDLSSLGLRDLSTIEVPPRNELMAAEQSYSTFSLNVSDVSFLLAKDALLNRDQRPDPDRVRVEDFVNAFDYNDPVPSLEEQVACLIEQSAHPYRQQRNLIRIGVSTAATGRNQALPLQVTLLLDNSGSMEREDRQESVNRAVTALASQLSAKDRVNLISFSRQPQLRMEALPGDRASELVQEVNQTPTEGGTNVEAALQLAGEVALRNDMPTGQNRLVMVTDGAANLGDADPERLKEFARQLRMKGLALDVAGVGIFGLDDVLLTALTKEADGRYYALNHAGDAEETFVSQLAGALRPAAKNVKVQVHFNPNRVGNYRLMGYEEHRLDTEDFRDDSVDAAELAAAESGVALYQVEILPEGQGDVGEVSVRFQEVATGEMVERRWTMPYEPKAPSFDQASPSLQLAGTAAILAEQLQERDSGSESPLQELVPVMTRLRHHFQNQPRVEDLIRMVEKTRS